MIELRLLSATDDEVSTLQMVFEQTPDYSEKVLGHSPGPDEAQSMFDILPPGFGFEDKFVFGIYENGKAIGCIDLIRGYPDRKTAMLGLLLLSQKKQGRGFGKIAYAKLEEFVQKWGGIEKIRIAVVRTNEQVLGFWKKMGFHDTGIRKPYHYETIRSEHLILEKAITTKKPRYTMRAELTQQIQPELFLTHQASIDLAEVLGQLMDRAYRGTIDDEGETLAQYIEETRATMKGKYGVFVPEASFWIERDARAVSATIVTMWKERPLLAFSVTDPKYQGQGMARFLIKKTMNAMLALGHTHIDLGVTRGNAAAEHLYKTIGFMEVT